MAKLLRSNGVLVEKPRHAAGYEVDAEITSKSQRLLVEIKSSNSASDIYSGMGQLQLYRKLLPRLANHVPVLLLPRLPHPALVEAIAACGVQLCTFVKADTNDAILVDFSDEFLKLCGIEA